MNPKRVTRRWRAPVWTAAALILALRAFSSEPAGGAGSLSGTVQGPDGKSVAGALVAAVPFKEMRPEKTARSDKDGSFKIEGLKPGTFGLTATGPGLTASYLGDLKVEPGKTVEGLKLVLGGEGFTVNGIVKNDEGKPLASAVVLPFRYSEVEGDIFQTETDEHGVYEVKLPIARYELWVDFPEHEPESRSISKAEDQTVDFQLVSLAKASLPAPGEVVDWVRLHAIPLSTCEAGHGFTDMEPLKKVVGDAHVVALGEATHGTREFFQFKHRMLEFLVSEMGFTAFAIEASFPESLAVNDYVLNGKGDPAQALAGLYFWTWNTEEVLDMIHWMRRYNEDPAHTKKVKFFGFDMQFTQVAVPYVLGYLKKVDPEYAPKAMEALKLIAGETATTTYAKQPDKIKSATAAALKDILRRFDDRKADYVALSSPEDWALARQHALVISQAEMLYGGDPSLGNVRDRSMAQNIRWILDHEGPGARVVVWAHNGHVSFAKTRDACSRMGCHLKEALGKDLLVIGFAFDQGSFQAVDSTTGKGLHDFTVGPAPPGSIDAALAQTGLPLFVVDLRQIPEGGAAGTWWQTKHKEHGIGALYDEATPGNFWMLSTPVKTYDALFFVEKTTAAKPNRLAKGRKTPGADAKPALAPANLDFEKGEAGQVPTGWFLPEASKNAGYKAVLTKEEALQGRLCAVLSGEGYGFLFGTLMQKFDASRYRGKRVRFKAAVRAEIQGEVNWIGLWVRVDRKDGSVGFFDNMRDRPIASKEWKFYQVEGDVAPDADTINVGLLLEGTGKAWIDAASFESVGETATQKP